MGQEGSAGPDPYTALPPPPFAVTLLHLTLPPLRRRAGSAGGGTLANKTDFRPHRE